MRTVTQKVYLVVKQWPRATGPRTRQIMATINQSGARISKEQIMRAIAHAKDLHFIKGRGGRWVVSHEDKF